MENEEYYRKAAKLWGPYKQILQLFEEMSELQTAICHFGRYKAEATDVAEEIADVQLMLNQITHLFDIESKVKAHYKSKLESFKGMIKERWALDQQKKLHNKDSFYDFNPK